ncbi:MAG: MSHA pilin protein MshC [Pseudohongiellaceae bacterium]|jgi:MSHA pilin protein MshC
MTYPQANSESGFTLIEMVSVMVLLGILAVTAIPSFTGTDDFSAYSAQDQIIAGARMAQQRAMYDRAADNCYSLNIASNVITVQRFFSATGITAPVGPTQEWLDGIIVDSDVAITPNPTNIYFDGLGNSVTSCVLSTPVTATVAIGSPAILNVCVNPVGYIDAC